MPPVVELDQVGFDSLIASTLIIAGLIAYRSTKISPGGLVSYAFFFAGVSVVGILLFYISPTSTNLSIPPLWTLLFEGASAVAYFMLFGSRRIILVGMLECFAIGAFAMIVGDAFRTYVIPVNLLIVYWAGAGFGDLVFQFGLFMAGIYFAISVGLGKKNELLVSLFGVKIGKRVRSYLDSKRLT